MTPLIAAVDWLNISINLLLVIHVIICLLLALLVLMQRPKQEGLGAAFGSGLTDQAFGARTTDVLQKGTVYLGTLFFIVTIVLAILIGKRQSATPTIVADSADATEEVAPAVLPVIPEADAPVVMPDAEKKEEPKKEEKSDEKVQEEKAAEETPVAPETPEVPEVPAAPEAPEVPATPVTPAEAPAAPEVPAEPATGDNQ